MSDYANLREAYHILLNQPPEVPGDFQEMIDMDRERGKNRNPDPEPEMALLKARTQADWHEAQQALLDSESPDEERHKMELEMAGEKSAKQEKDGKPDLSQQTKHREQAKEKLEKMRQGDFGGGLVGASSRQPASTPGYVPAPVQGQTPPVPGREQSPNPTHRESHQQTAEAHRQASQIHQDAAGRQPADQLRHEDAAEAHRRQAEFHDRDSRGRANAPEVDYGGDQDEDRRRQQQASQGQRAAQQGQDQSRGGQGQSDQQRQEEEFRQRQRAEANRVREAEEERQRQQSQSRNRAK